MYEPERMKLALAAMSKAGWVSKANIAELSQSHTKVSVTPTKAGLERLQALFILLSELDAPCGRLNDDELGYVFGLARTYAPDQNSHSWPSQISSIDSSESPRS